MDKLISKSLITAAEKIADAQVQAEFLAPAARDGFVETFLAELDDECLLDAEEHTALALKVVQAQARVAKLSPEKAAQQFLLAYQQSARHEKLGTGFPEAPAVPVEQSLQDDHLICLEDGKKVKLLKRHLRTYYGMTPNDYRKKWGLPADYPMVPRSLTLRNSLRNKLDLPRQTDLQPQDS